MAPCGISPGEFGFRGTGPLVTDNEPARPDVQAHTPLVREVSLRSVQWEDHDLVIVFDALGDLTAHYGRAEVLSVWSRFRLDHEDLAFLLSTPSLFAILQAFEADGARGEEQSVKAGKALLNGRRFRAAIPFLEFAVQRNPQSADAHYYLGACFDALGDRAAATAHYRTGIELDAALPARSPWLHDARARMQEHK